MTLYLVRHGNALAKTGQHGRPLSQQGEAEVRLMAGHLAHHRTRVRRILHSGKLRAEQTAFLLAERLLSPAGEVAQLPGLLPEDAVDSMAATVETLGPDVMLVGHLPFMGGLVSQLVTGKDKFSIVEFDTATVVCLQYIGGSYWTIRWAISPKIIADSNSNP